MPRQRKGAKPSAPKKQPGELAAPFKKPPEVLQPLIETLEEKHVYIFHIDSLPVQVKRNIFLIPVGMNIAIAALFIWRMYYILPWYLRLLASTLGYPNETTLIAAEVDWDHLLPELGRRTAQFTFDLMLYVFVWPWPYNFFINQTHSNPLQWRWNVGFRDREVVVRRSRSWDKAMRDVADNSDARTVLMAYLNAAASPMLLQEKTGYLTMNREWDLDWGVMIDATTMVDKKMAALEAFRLVVLVHQDAHGWLAIDLKQSTTAAEDERRRQVFLFRDALVAQGKEDLFYRWIEMIQFEATQEGGITPEKQEKVAQQVRDLFQKEGVNFDELWKESVGTDGIAGM